MIKILLAEEHNIVRNGISALLEKEPDMVVSCEAANGHQVLDWLDKAAEKPDIILTDMNMQGINGIDLISKLQMNYRVLVLSTLDHESHVIEGMNAGASGYLLKSVNKEEMLFAIRHIHKGGSYICSELSLKLLSRLQEFRSRTKVLSKPGVELSEREWEVLNLTADGYTNKQMAEKLFSSRRTIEGHRQSLMEKTGSKNTATLIRFAVQYGLVK